ncbi:uncharacterized protein [Drosophila kikkawai]|uniref:Uncharacterized protein n=1 Tax=Drosophila kikkawai TaxID=30033 RepID=A0A6P4JU28_DROKI|nr:uncharacterized protein LOC108086202 [Drosophila kikkawai]
MSQRNPKVEVPRDLSLAQQLRREITRNSAEISLNFWQEFENIRATQRDRMNEERLRRERINTLMRDGQKEANKEAEALSRSISAQGMITLPMASAPDPPQTPLLTSIVEEIKNYKTRPKSGIRTNSKIKQKAENKSEKSSSSIKPGTSAFSKLSVATASSSKTSPSTSKMRWTKKSN